MSSESTTAIGLAIGLTSVFASSLGQTLVRLSSMRAAWKAELEGIPETPPFRRPAWVIGFILNLSGAPLDTAAALFVPLSMITLLLATKQLVLTFFSGVLLKEPISRMGGLGVLSCAGGAALSLTSVPEQERLPFETPADFFTPGITGYCAAAGIGLAGLFFFVFCKKQKVGQSGLSLSTLAMPVLSGWCLAGAKLFNAVVGRLPPGADVYALEWIWATIAIGVLAVGVIFVNMAGLERMSPHLLFPIEFGFFAVIMGVQGFFFGEFEGIERNDAIIWFVGMGMSLAGVVMVVQGSPKEDHEVKEQEAFLEENEEWFEAMESRISMTRSASARGASPRSRLAAEVGREMF